MRVMMDVFSGRPNPVWDVSASLARRVVQLLARQGGPALGGMAPAVLGFRGLVVQPTWEYDGLPPAPFRLGVPPAAAAEATPQATRRAEFASVPHDEREAAFELLSSARPWIATDVMDEAARSLEGRRHERENGAERSRARPAQVAAPDTSSPCALMLSQYRPWFWNAPAVRLQNNCYNYASNFVSNYVAQPGRRVGRQYQAFTCEAVARAAVADGYRAHCDGAARMVALAVWPGQDFHWYRRHEDFWAHKLGIFTARNVDNRGRVITGALDPATCDRGPYTQFCSYLFVPSGVEVL